MILKRLQELGLMEPSYAVAQEYQALLITLLFLGTCGQRREMITYMDIEVIISLLIEFSECVLECGEKVVPLCSTIRENTKKGF